MGWGCGVLWSCCWVMKLLFWRSGFFWCVVIVVFVFVLVSSCRGFFWLVFWGFCGFVVVEFFSWCCCRWFVKCCFCRCFWYFGCLCRRCCCIFVCGGSFFWWIWLFFCWFLGVVRFYWLDIVFCDFGLGIYCEWCGRLVWIVLCGVVWVCFLVFLVLG